MLTKIFFLFVGLCLLRESEGGNNRPYGVSLTGVEGAGQLGQDTGANGYAGSSLVAPLAAEGFGGPVQRNAPNNAFAGDPTGVGFGGFGWRNAPPSSGY